MSGEPSPTLPPPVQRERTRLSWQRTLLSLGITSALAASVVVHRARGGVVVALTLAGVILCALATLGVALRRTTQLTERAGAQLPPLRDTPALVATLVGLLAAVAVLLVFAAGPS